MADTTKPEIPLTSTTAEIDGEVVSANHKPETYDLIAKAREELKDWHVQWGKKPDKSDEAEENAARLREENDALTKIYRAPELPDRKNRVRNLMHITEFCRRLDRILGPAIDGGSRIFINDPPRHPAIDEHMKGLFIKMRGMEQFIYHVDLPPGWKKVCSVQVPYMSEWGDMNRDARGMFQSWKYIGWRGQVLLRLILAGAITEEEAHKEFGVPQGVEVDREYRRILESWRRDGQRTQ